MDSDRALIHRKERDTRGTSSTRSRTKARSFLRSSLPRHSDGTKLTPIESVKGDLGLITLYDPPSPAVADVVFVHGLGGGSRKTWTAEKDPELYWPKEFLPRDAAFQEVRVHTYGYNSDWANDSILNIHDFAKTLIISIRDCPTIPRDAHSMGGLVIKRAYILALQMEIFKQIGDRIKAMLFLATPHTGSGHAKTLERLLSLDLKGQRQFLNDLSSGSQAIQAITEEFTNHCGALHIRSFYETLPTKLSFTGFSVMIVEKSSASLNLPNEQVQPIEANHRNICKFSRPSDANYLALRNAIANTLDDVMNDAASDMDTVIVSRKDINDFLGVDEPPEEDLWRRQSSRVEGSCEWLLEQKKFESWKKSPDPQMLLIHAKPATGKSVLAAHLITRLREAGHACSFYFFEFNKAKASVNSFLRSIAWQMTALDPTVMDVMNHAMRKEESIHHGDWRTLWRKLFLEGIFKAKPSKRHFWVIDALDECSSDADLVPLLLKAGESSHIRILVTSRLEFRAYTTPVQTKTKVVSQQISARDTESDIYQFLRVSMDRLPYADEEDRKNLVAEIVGKAKGCFLWVRLVSEELSNVNTSTERQQVLEEMPSDMDALYSRIVAIMASRPLYGKRLATAILTWVTCCINPLSTTQLLHALETDLADTVKDLEKAIRTSCGQLVYVDSQSNVQMIHPTAREFLQQPDLDSEFAINAESAHGRLALGCLQYLNGPDLKVSGTRKLSVATANKKRNPFISYAAHAVFEHISRAKSTETALVVALTKFLSSPNVLSWIEYIASSGRLDCLVQAGSSLKNFLRRRSAHMGLIGNDAATLEAWATDLPRIVTKFGRQLLGDPGAIHRQIPPFCPRDTAIYRQFASSTQRPEVVGLEATTWDDCVSTIVSPEDNIISLACSDLYFAIGLASGKVVIYDGDTCQESGRLDHGASVRLLEFDEESPKLASVGYKFIRIWDLDSGQELHKFNIAKHCMQVVFVDSGNLLLVALKNNRLLTFNLITGEELDATDWTQDLDRAGALSYPQPTAVTFSHVPDERRFLASVARGYDIILWDIEEEAMVTTYGKFGGSKSRFDKSHTSATVTNMLFNPAPGTMMLAVSYADGDVVIFDTDTGKIKETRTGVNAHILAASRNGVILATGDPEGTIQLFDFETLRLSYRITSREHGIKALAFNWGSTRLMDIRGSQCRVWEPVILLNDGEDDTSETISISTTFTEATVDDSKETILTTAVAFGSERDDCVFTGKDNGTLSVHSLDTGNNFGVLYSHALGVPIVLLIFDSQSRTMTSVDSSSRIMCRKLIPEGPGKGFKAAEVLFDDRIGTAVDQVVPNRGHSLLLMSSAKTDTLYSISTKGSEIVKSLHWDARKSYRWGTHPNDPEKLILIVDTRIHLYSFSTLEPITATNGIQLEYSILPELSIMYFQFCFSSTMIASRWMDHSARRHKSKLLLFEATSFNDNSKMAVPVPKYEPLANQVEYLIGSHHDRLVFMLGSGWICSANIDTFEEGGYMRHFFIPGHWLTSTRDLLISISPGGDIVFVKHDEVAVIKRGLDVRYQASSTR